MAYHRPSSQFSLWKTTFSLVFIYLLIAEAAISKISYKRPVLTENKHQKKPIGMFEKSTTNQDIFSSDDVTPTTNNSPTTQLPLLKDNVESSTDATLSLTTEKERILKSTTVPTKIVTKQRKCFRLSTNRLTTTTTNTTDIVPCTCGIFLNSQFTKGSPNPPRGEAVISNTVDRTFACNGVGQKQCQTKCLEQIVRHLPNSANILCAALDHDIHKQRAYLFTKNCQDVWINTNLTAGREYCCKNGEPYSCKS
ncbi:follicle cell protein 3C [Musca autumnalis]|uniref:follicle cell protein 3C n=1 Tax=Musca autumnalis TaxID=221902 RepID=UPI003CE6ACB7